MRTWWMMGRRVRIDSCGSVVVGADARPRPPSAPGALAWHWHADRSRASSAPALRGSSELASLLITVPEIMGPASHASGSRCLCQQVGVSTARGGTLGLTSALDPVDFATTFRPGFGRKTWVIIHQNEQ